MIHIKNKLTLHEFEMNFYFQILSLTISAQADGSPIANIRVNSQQEAQFTISQLHRQKLGHKRIIISYAQNNSPDPEELRAMVFGLLQVFIFLNLR